MDIVLIVLLILGIAIGYKRGFIDGIFSLVGLFLAIILAFSTYKFVVRTIIPKTGLDVKVYNYVETKVSGESTSIKLPEVLQNYIDADIIVNQSPSLAIEKIANFIVNVLTIIILICIFYLIITIVRLLLDTIAKLPILNLFNKIAGAALGGLKAFALVLIAFSVIGFLPVFGKGEKAINFINNSVFAKQIYIKNPVSKMIVIRQMEKTNDNEDIDIKNSNEEIKE